MAKKKTTKRRVVGSKSSDQTVLRTTVHQGDCREIIHKLGMFDFIFADPPFNIGQDYKGYNDKQARQTYFRSIDTAIDECAEALTKDGVLCLHGPDDLVETYLLRARVCGLERIAWINWHYRFGQCNRSNWIDARCHCLIYTLPGAKYTWNPEAVLVESDRSSTYGDKRIHDTENGGMRLPGTVWGIPSDGPFWGRVQGNSTEKRPGHPNQLPEKYLERLLRAYTNPGDRVLDPFGGSGTTAVVAQALGRSVDTIDISEANCKSIRERLVKGTVRI